MASDRAVLEALGRSPVLGTLPARERTLIGAAASVREMRAGDAAWRRGDPAWNLGLVLAGRLKVTRVDGGHDVLIDLAVPGDLVGEVAFTTRASYEYDVVCLRRARILLIPSGAVRSALRANPEAAAALALDLAGQVLRLSRLVEDLSAGSVERRLARVFLRLAERAGTPIPGNGLLVPLRLRRADLAAMAATTLESASRKISQWKRRRWIEPQPVGYLLRDLAALRALAGP
jgi:CRP-like cAMP-binding protein